MRLLVIIAAVILCGVGVPGAAPQEAQQRVTVSARRYAFTPARIEVRRGDIVIVQLETEDIPHSFAIDALRICKRVTPGAPVTFEFRVDEAGTYPFYCNLIAEEGCRHMRGELVVR
jgi:cytochrome c oxidase subunit 2